MTPSIFKCKESSNARNMRIHTHKKCAQKYIHVQRRVGDMTKKTTKQQNQILTQLQILAL